MEIEITLKNYRCFPDSRPATFTLHKGLTALVGVNNAGKSSLLKSLYELRPLFAKLKETFHGEPFKQQSFEIAAVSDCHELFCRSNDRPMEIGLRITPSCDPNNQSVSPEPSHIILTWPRTQNRYKLALKHQGRTIDQEIGAQVSQDGPKWVHSGSVVANTDHVLTACQALVDCLYVPSFRNALNLSTNLHDQTQYFDIAVGQQFIRNWRSFQTGDSYQNTERANQVLKDVAHIFGHRELMAFASDDTKTLRLLVDGRSFSLLEVGSGLAQFLIVLANAAQKNPSYILIDEPETSLHPSLQLDFLTTLNSYAREGIAFSTHSLGLARSSANRIYSVQRHPDGDSQVNLFEQTPSLVEFLGELNYSGYQQLGFHKILLVEGPTDVLVFQQFLRLYQKDHEVVLLPLGGKGVIKANALPQLQEIRRITDQVFAVVDSDRAGPGMEPTPEVQGFANACRDASVECYVLERGATENYFPERAIKEALGPNYGELGPYERLKEAPRRWNKVENWRIARKMTKPELEATDLGQFLKSIL